MGALKKAEGQDYQGLAEVLTDPSSVSTDCNVEETSEGHADGPDDLDCKKGAWTAEEDKELSRLIEVRL